ncbi:hypothetical protein TWF694_000157 [Orbilia ellipsospora]|uniref:Phosphoglycerate mutase-like protein n=1 Tax=Orbilia ellipsospora TaxID=2528407 RepID=A0AAV9XMT1_9PEZI
MSVPRVHIIRHGQALHNIERGYPHRDSPLTTAGHLATKSIDLPAIPDLIIISPMSRTIQTAMNIFSGILDTVKVQIWPDLRESHDANCNKGLSRTELAAKFPRFDFGECQEEWDYPPHTVEGATIRAERVRRRLKELSKVYINIAIITHRGFIAFLTKGDRYDVCETRSYRFATDEEAQLESLRKGTHVDTKEPCDFGPTLLLPIAVQTFGPTAPENETIEARP